jgi:hypothetical protein
MIPFFAAILASIVLAPSGTTDARAFEAAQKVARANAKTAAGRRYQPLFAKRFSESQAAELGRCVERQSAPDLSPFEALAEVDAAGSVEEVLVRPASNVALCLRETIRKARFPRPPRGRYWTSTVLRMKK